MVTYDTLFVGIDVSKAKHDITTMNEHKKCVYKNFVIQEHRTGYSYLMNRLNYLKLKYNTKTFYIGMEATGDYWKNLFHFLRQHSDCIPIVINPVKTKAFAKTELRRAKTDPVNAKDIALFLIEKKPNASYYRPLILDNIKDLDTQINALNKQQTMTTNRLRIELGKVAPEIERHFKNIRGKQIMAVLSHCPSAKDIVNTSIKEINKIHYGDQQWRLPKAFPLKLKELAADSIAHKSGFGAGFVVQSLLRTIYHYQMEIQNLKEQIKQLYENYDSDKVDLLTSIKGVTKETAIVLEAYFGDVFRFNNVKEFVAFFGMNPVVNQSGKQNNRKSYLEKKGSAVVRRKLYFITLTLIRQKVQPFSAFYVSLTSKGKPKLVAIAATMRKLLAIMFHMITKNEKFIHKKS